MFRVQFWSLFHGQSYQILFDRQLSKNYIFYLLSLCLQQENATAATQKVKEGMSKVLGGITKALVIESEEKEQTRAGRKPSGEHIFDRAKASVHIRN